MIKPGSYAQVLDTIFAKRSSFPIVLRNFSQADRLLMKSGQEHTYLHWLASRADWHKGISSLPHPAKAEAFIAR